MCSSRSDSAFRLEERLDEPEERRLFAATMAVALRETKSSSTEPTASSSVSMLFSFCDSEGFGGRDGCDCSGTSGRGRVVEVECEEA